MTDCPYQLDVSKLGSAIETLSAKVASLVDFNKWVTKWLLIAVIVMALGQKGYDIVEKFAGNRATTAQAEAQKM